ncbi:hypothetical protein ACFLS1_04385 [Verrucomicrobiota bacterium]
MRKLLCWMSVFVWLLAATSALVFTGCEKDDDDDDSASSGGLSITPASASLVATNTSTVTFTANGGTTPYAWNVNNSLGSLVSSGNTAIYTATTNAGTNFVTVTDAATNAVTATVTQN